ncbi:MAG: glycosyltransferase [Planctomycetota bacterium]
MKNESPTSSIFAVMGTGRSGTSLITKILDILGVYLGPESAFMNPSPSNPKGYFELQPIFDLNNEILHVLGGNWLSPPPLPEGWEKSSCLREQRIRLNRLVHAIFNDAPCWAWKDPRSCWTLPFWRQDLQGVKAVFALRNPIDVARSLERANGIHIGVGLNYWHQSLTAALKCTMGMDRLFLFYDDIIEDCFGRLQQIASFIGRPELAENPEIRSKVASFVEKKLHRNRTSCDDILNHKELTFTAQSLYMALRAYVRAGPAGSEIASAHGDDFADKITLFAEKSLLFQQNLDVLINEYERCAGPRESSTIPESSPDVPDVSVVIPVFNQLALTERCLELIYEHGMENGSFETIVVDNGSSDGTAAFLKQAGRTYPQFKVISSAENRAFAWACNQGAAASRGEYILFLNNDIEITPHWVGPLKDVLDNDPDVAAVSGKLLYPNQTLQHVGMVICNDRVIGDPLIAKHLFHRAPADLKEANEPRRYQGLSAAAMMVRRSAFQQVNGFDELYWNGYEDIDLCFRFNESGWQCVYEPKSVMYHLCSQSGPERFRQAAQNIRRFHDKWLSKITPDLVIDRNGGIHDNRSGGVSRYRSPRCREDINNRTLRPRTLDPI